MNFEPQKFFIGLMDFFSILLPGALLTYLVMGDVGPSVLGDKYEKLTGAAGWAAFFASSYLVGHILFLVGSWLDEFPYDWLRRRTLNYQVSQLARRARPLPRSTRLAVWAVFGREQNVAVERAGKIKEHMLKGLQAKDAINTYQWSKAFLAKEHSESLAAVQRFEADSKFFRSFVVVLIVLAVMWGLQAAFLPVANTASEAKPPQFKWLLAIVSFLLILPALWRYLEQRYKATNQAYWSVITVTAQNGKVVFPEPQSSADRPTHAGGVVYRKRWWNKKEPKYLVVEAKNDPTQWVLPKGHIEPKEHPRETAVREVHEETGVWARICDDLRSVSYSVNGKVTNCQFYLMEFRRWGRRTDLHRKHQWLPLKEAVRKVCHVETRDVLNLAGKHREDLLRKRCVPLDAAIAGVSQPKRKEKLHIIAINRDALQRAAQRRIRL